MKDARVNNLGGLLTRTARLFPSHHALIAEEKSWTWKEVDQRVQAMASAMKNLGIEKGTGFWCCPKITSNFSRLRGFLFVWVVSGSPLISD